MNNRDHHGSIDSDRSEGSAKKLGGDLKEGIGSLLGDEKIKREGQGDRAEGKLQNAWGGAKDSAREMIDGKKR